MLGCDVGGAHLHVIRRENVNGAWAKSRHVRAVPLDFLVVQAADQYQVERHQCPGARDSDFLLVNLFRPPLGSPVTPEAVGELFEALSVRAGLARAVTPHRCRHAFGSNLADAGVLLDEIQGLLGHASPLSVPGLPASGPGAPAGRGGEGAPAPRVTGDAPVMAPAAAAGLPAVPMTAMSAPPGSGMRSTRSSWRS